MLVTLARVFGAIFIVVGLLGFVPPLVPNGNLLGLFPVNAVHNLVHIGLGVWGLIAGASLAVAVIYFRGIAIIYGLLAVLGLIPATNTLFGLAPIHGADVILHAVLALIAAYLGFWSTSKPAAHAPGT
ncbi:MAG TPA: DUF4383 domain-containing protein [Burkholderiales bacterium]|nr:DUF4383 domain-containing protein [Burkholderiales bacterium]